MLKIAIIIGSTRPGRRGEAIATWALEQARGRTDAQFELVDIAAYDLPLLDEPVPPSAHRYTQPHTIAWAETIASFDAFVFVTPEYNHGTSAALKNAIDFLYAEWNNKAAGFISYGTAGGVRAAENLRLVLGEVQVADVRSQVAINVFTDYVDGAFVPSERHLRTFTMMLDQVIAWAGALKPLREAHPTHP